jgi:hypothetical protein
MNFLFGSSKPKVSKYEFRDKLMPTLYGRGWNQKDRKDVKQVFAGHLEEGGSQSGIDKSEIEKGIEILDKTTDISKERLEFLKSEMIKYAK